jgi:hypothetical protein
MSVRLMRGQVVVRELKQESALWSPDEDERKKRTHVGEVIAMGPPALIYDKYPVEPGFVVGDLVQYHLAHHLGAHTRVWPGDGLPALWIPQNSVDGVWT